MKKVLVLMSTYNGEKYLGQQIESILDQEKVDVHLMIRDDGSTDNTRNVLKRYENNDRITIKYGKNTGVGVSFLKLLYVNMDADYYAFSDQDDVWKKDKLIAGIRKLEEINGPALYASNQTVTDKDLKIIGTRYDTEPKCNLASAIMSCKICGCTMVMNYQLKRLLSQKICRPSKQIVRARNHDAWVLAFANTAAKFVFDMDSHILYRQHEQNVVGAYESNKIDKILSYFTTARFLDRESTRRVMARDLIRATYEINISNENKNILKLFSNTDSVKGKIDIIRNREIAEMIGKGRIKFAIEVFMGLV